MITMYIDTMVDFTFWLISSLAWF